MAWAGFIELGLFLLLGGVVLWVFFKPIKKATQHQTKDDNATDKNNAD